MEDMQYDKLRDEYIALRKANRFNSSYFYKYYTYKGGDLDFNAFNQVFRLGSLHDVLEHMDRIFKLDKVYSKDGELLKIIF